MRAVDVPKMRSAWLAWLAGRRESDLRPYGGTDLSPEEVLYNGEVPPAVSAGARYSDWLAGITRVAELFHVNSELEELATHAGTSLPPFEVHREMLPATHGFLLWSDPIDAGDDRPVLGFIWAAIREGVWLESLGPWPTPTIARLISSGLLPAGAEQVRAAVGPLSNDQSWLFPWTEQAMIHETESSRGKALAALIAAWMLMGQTITVEERVRPAPADRRRYARRGDPDPTVRTMALRRRRLTGQGDHRESAEHRHQWMVSGHWRNQWYASVEAHRPIWIAPHIKGPEGAPLLKSERVYTLRR